MHTEIWCIHGKPKPFEVFGLVNAHFAGSLRKWTPRDELEQILCLPSPLPFFQNGLTNTSKHPALPEPPVAQQTYAEIHPRRRNKTHHALKNKGIQIEQI